ncbi:MAG TPA: DUF4926 domain-containing protein [Caldilineaceae bacterium]|nr:DUF4926 domain-containing protein [Caldilineaceae bacterium]
MIQPDLFDTVELLIDLPNSHIRAGALGAIVEQYDERHFEIEFSNEAGETEQLCSLSADQFIVVWRNVTQSPATMADLMAQLTLRLDESEQREILDFARFLHARHQQKQPVGSLAK